MYLLEQSTSGHQCIFSFLSQDFSDRIGALNPWGPSTAGQGTPWINAAPSCLPNSETGKMLGGVWMSPDLLSLFVLRFLGHVSLGFIGKVQQVPQDGGGEGEQGGLPS